MEWKRYADEKPELGSVCVVVNANGNYYLRRFEEVVVSEGGRHWSSRARAIKYKEADKVRTHLFVPLKADGGSIPKGPSTEILYYMVLPEPPSDVREITKLKTQIAALEMRLKELEDTDETN